MNVEVAVLGSPSLIVLMFFSVRKATLKRSGDHFFVSTGLTSALMFMGIFGSFVHFSVDFLQAQALFPQTVLSHRRRFTQRKS